MSEHPKLKPGESRMLSIEEAAEALGVDLDDLYKQMRTAGTHWLVFAGDAYYPDGGAHDFYGVYLSIDDARTAAQNFVRHPGPQYKQSFDKWAHVASASNPANVVCSFATEQPECEPAKGPGFGPRTPGNALGWRDR